MKDGVSDRDVEDLRAVPGNCKVRTKDMLPEDDLREAGVDTEGG
jgi:hypothetical protein